MAAPVAALPFTARQSEPIVFTELALLLADGTNRFEIAIDGEAELPYTLGLEYRAVSPRDVSHAAGRRA